MPGHCKRVRAVRNIILKLGESLFNLFKFSLSRLQLRHLSAVSLVILRDQIRGKVHRAAEIDLDCVTGVGVDFRLAEVYLPAKYPLVVVHGVVARPQELINQVIDAFVLHELVLGIDHLLKLFRLAHFGS